MSPFKKERNMMKKKVVGVLLLGMIMTMSLGFQGCFAFKTTANRYATTPGTHNGYKLIKADWYSVNDVFQSRYGRISKQLVLGFCDHARKEIWFTEGADDKLLERFKWYVSNKEHEIKHATGDDLGENRQRLWELRHAKRLQKLENWIQESQRW